MFWKKKKTEPIHPRPSPDDDCEFDIENRTVFSVERDEDGLTIIGYRVGDEDREWYFNCPLDKHTHFIRRFRAKLGLNVTGSTIQPIDQSKNIT